MADEQPVAANAEASAHAKNTVAVTVLILSGGGIVVFAVIALIQNPKDAMALFNSLLPVLGTWVGTVLAYYFTSQNFMSASKSVADMARLATSPAGLEAAKYVRDKMIPFNNMVSYTYPDDKDSAPDKIPGKIQITDLLAKLKESGMSRLPVIDLQKRPIYVIQQRNLDHYWANQTSQPYGTLQDTFDKVPGMKERFSILSGFAIIKPDATLSEAKQKMESIPDCTDVLVTTTGEANDPVIGWVTDDTIRQSAKV